MTQIATIDKSSSLRDEIDVSGSGLPVDQATQLAGERNPGDSNQYGVSVGECNITNVGENETDSAVSVGAPALCFGVIMETGQSGAIVLKDSATTVLSITPGANASVDLKGAKFDTSLVVTTAASAACVILWRPQG